MKSFGLYLIRNLSLVMMNKVKLDVRDLLQITNGFSLLFRIRYIFCYLFNFNGVFKKSLDRMDLELSLKWGRMTDIGNHMTLIEFIGFNCEFYKEIYDREVVDFVLNRGNVFSESEYDRYLEGVYDVGYKYGVPKEYPSIFIQIQ